MRTLVVYYSLSGNTRRVATALARELGADLEEIRCRRYRMGFWSFLRAGYDSWADKMPAIEPLAHSAGGYDLVVIGGPMWAWRAATPVRACLHATAGTLPKVAFFLTLGGAPADNAFREMRSLAGREPVAELVVRQADVGKDNYASAVHAFAASLRERATEAAGGRSAAQRA